MKYKFVPVKDTTMEELLWVLGNMDLKIPKEVYDSMPKSHKRNWVVRNEK